MVLFCAAIRKDSGSVLRLPFLSHIQAFSCEISLVCRLTYSYSCFPSHLFSGYFSSFYTCVFLLLFLTFLSTSSLGGKILCILMNFLVLWSISWSSSLLYFKNGPEYLTRGTTKVFIPSMRFLLFSFVSSSFLVLLTYSFFFSFNSAYLIMSARSITIICRFPFLQAFWFFLGLVVL